MSQSITTPSGIELRLGQKWREMDGRMRRIVTVVGWDAAADKVQIYGVKVTNASVRRFSGKSGGYQHVSG